MLIVLVNANYHSLIPPRIFYAFGFVKRTLFPLSQSIIWAALNRKQSCFLLNKQSSDSSLQNSEKGEQGS